MDIASTVNRRIESTTERLAALLGVDHQLPLEPALEAPRRTIETEAGAVSYYVSREGEGRPIVLVHSVNAAASAFEMRPLFERFRGTRPVAAVDLPGFGFSERGPRSYDPALLGSAIEAVIDELGGSADVVALSLSSEMAALVARTNPEAISSLVLISPTGFSSAKAESRAQRRGEIAGRWIEKALRVPLWSQPLYDVLTSRASIRYFLDKSFAGSPSDELATYAYRSAHQPGARFAPYAFLAGRLFTPEVRDLVYAALSCPVLVLYDDDAHTDFGALPAFVQSHSHWVSVRIPGTRGMPHFDQPQLTFGAIEEFWENRAGGQPSPAAPSPRLA